MRTVNGNNVADMAALFEQIPFERDKPSLVLAETVKGKGISFMENVVSWHHHVPSNEEYTRAMQELAQAEEQLLETRHSIGDRSVELGIPNLEEFGQTLVRLGQEDREVMVVTSDSRGSGKLVPFGQSLPEQIVEVGIAEQNLVGIAAGLASTGKKVFAVSPACFLTTRALEQIKNDVAYSDNPVKVIGISGGRQLRCAGVNPSCHPRLCGAALYQQYRYCGTGGQF